MLRTVVACTASLVVAAGARGQGARTAQYRLTFEATWSSATHPIAFPSNPHFSGLIGGTHNGSVVFWEEGALASPGIKSMAETGSKSLLRSEVQSAIQNGDAFAVISGGGIGLSPGSVSVEFTADSRYPLVSVVSMIAPSPDWFVGTMSEPLIENGRWIPMVDVEGDPWDAGTDSGQSYSSPNQATVPPVPIFNLSNHSPFAGTPALGSFVFELLSLDCYADCDQSTGLGELDIFDFLCFQDRFVAGDPGADCDGSSVLDIFDFLCFQDAFVAGCV